MLGIARRKGLPLPQADLVLVEHLLHLGLGRHGLVDWQVLVDTVRFLVHLFIHLGDRLVVRYYSLLGSELGLGVRVRRVLVHVNIVAYWGGLR